MYQKLLIAIGLVLSICASNALAQDMTVEDEINMQQCVETVHDIQRSGDVASLRDCIGAASRMCQEEPNGYSTIGMSNCAMRETQWWDNYLNFLYQELKTSLTSDQFTKLRDAQRIWIKYRDATCAFSYEYWKEGTISGPIHAGCIQDTTANRAVDLSEYLSWTTQ